MAEHITGLVDKATSEYLIGTDYGVNIELSDFLNTEPNGASIAIKQIAKKLGHKKSRSKLLALELVETLVKNCEHVHPCVGSKEFQADMIKLVQSKKTKDNVKERALEIIQYWADSFRERRDLPMFGQTYELLRRTGVSFPARRKEEQLLVFKQKQPPRTSPVPGGAPSQANSGRPQNGLGEFAPIHESALLALEMINYIAPDEEDPNHNEALKDLVLLCRESAPKVRGVIESGNFSSEQAMDMLLGLNDDLMKVSEKFDELIREHKEFVQTGTIKSRKPRARTPDPAPLQKSVDFLDFSDAPTAPMSNLSVGGAPPQTKSNSNSITNLMGSFDFIGPPSIGSQPIAPIAPIASAPQQSQPYNPFGGYSSGPQPPTQYGQQQQQPAFAQQPAQFKPQATQSGYNPYVSQPYANPGQATGGYAPQSYQQPATTPSYGSQALVAQPPALQPQILQPSQPNSYNSIQAQQPLRPQQPAPAQSKPDDFDDFAMLASSRHAAPTQAPLKPAMSSAPGPMVPGQHAPGQNVMTSMGMAQVASSTVAYPNYGQGGNPFTAPAQPNPYGGYPGQQQQPGAQYNAYTQPQNTYPAGANPYAQQPNQQQRR